MVTCQNHSVSCVQSIEGTLSLSSLLYGLTLEPLLRKLAALRDAGGLGCGRSVSTYPDKITVVVSSYRHTDLIGDTLQEYKAKANTEKAVGLQLGT